jgi:hypothetical protein
LEEDLFRIPFGMGVIYSSPGEKINSGKGGDSNIGAEYIESCVLQSKGNSITPGQTLIMENVSFIADRVLVWQDFSSTLKLSELPKLL